MSDRKPPRLARFLIQAMYDYERKYSIAGDLEEVFHERVRDNGPVRAVLWYWNQCLGAIPQFILYKLKWSAVMFGSAARIAVRNMKKYKGYSIINLFGLSVGMAASILIALWVQNELSYDKFHNRGDRIFKAVSTWGPGSYTTNSSWRLGPAFQEMYPEIESFSRVWPWHRSLVKTEGKSVMQRKFFLVDPEFFTMFSYPFVYGDPETALDDRHSIVISETTAHRYFGDQNPIGKSVHVVRDSADFTVTGVFRDVPENSHLQFDVAARVDLMDEQRFATWYFVAYTFMMLKDGTDVGQFNEKIKNFYSENVDPQFTAKLVMFPYTDVYLRNIDGEGRITQVYLFSAVALLILIIAGINFMNLSTARSARRAKEVGLRKVCGAERPQVIKQFLGESILLAFFSLLIALLMVSLTIPAFNMLTGKDLSLLRSFDMPNIAGMALIVVLTGLFTGSYPAFYLSRFNPVDTLKNRNNIGSTRSKFRGTLIVLQFTASVVLIVCTMVIYRQLEFLHNTDTGIQRENVIIMDFPQDSGFSSRYSSFRKALINKPEIENMSATMGNLVDSGSVISVRRIEDSDDNQVSMGYLTLDYGLIETLGMNLVQGRSFDKQFQMDETISCVLNETAARELGLESPVGTKLYFNHLDFPEERRNIEVIGVVKDFNFKPLDEQVRPFLMLIYRPWLTHLYIKTSGDVPAALSVIEETLSDFAPDYPFEFRFLDESYSGLYSSEQQTGRLLNAFTLLAVLVSCLGIFGLASYSAEQRTKEIGIRKVMGASESGLMILLTREFAFLILVSNSIALPVSYFLMENWLQDFVYRIHINGTLMAAAFFLSLLTALITVSYQAVKAAKANPVSSLRYE